MSGCRGTGVYPSQWVHLWVQRYLRKNFWRVAALMEYEDLDQEAAIVWLRCSKAYGHAGPKAVMAGFKVAIGNHLNNLSTRSTRHRGIFCDLGLDDPAQLEQLTTNLADSAPTASKTLSQIPAELAELFNSLKRLDAAQLAAIGLSRTRRNGGMRETTNEFLCRVFGLDRSKDVATPLRRLLELTA